MVHETEQQQYLRVISVLRVFRGKVFGVQCVAKEGSEGVCHLSALKPVWGLTAYRGGRGNTRKNAEWSKNNHNTLRVISVPPRVPR